MKRKTLIHLLLLAMLLTLVSCRPFVKSPPIYSYEVVNKFPHDPNAFTQGLVFHDGFLYEGTGLYGGSSLRKVDLDQGTVLQRIDLPDQYFGEGIVIVDDRIVQLTWREQVGFIYDRESFDLLGSFTYEGEGWGITTDGEYLIVSDGSERLTFFDPETLSPVREVTVSSDKGPVERLNELEYINGQVYANVWQTDLIARIDPANGLVTGWVDLSGLLDDEYRHPEVDVLNGIAYDPDEERLFVTGKRWPVVYEVELIN